MNCPSTQPFVTHCPSIRQLSDPATRHDDGTQQHTCASTHTNGLMSKGRPYQRHFHSPATTVMAMSLVRFPLATSS